MFTRFLSSSRFVSRAAEFLLVMCPPFVSHNFGLTESLLLNCVCVPSIVVRPITGTILLHYLSFLVKDN